MKHLLVLIAWFVLPFSASGQPLPLSLKRAVEMATSIDGNARIRIASEGIQSAEARSALAKSELLPGFSGLISTQSATQNLSGLGLGGAFSLPIPGFSFPTFVGPYSVFDARVSATQSVLDFSKLKRYQASRTGISAARSELDSTQEAIASHVARTYLAALRADADVETAEANAALSQAIQKQAENQRDAGTGTGIEITRAKVQLSADRQRLLAARNARRRATLELLRWLGLRLDTELQLTDKLVYSPMDTATLEQSVTRALQDRPDLAAQKQRESSARLSADASRLDHLPSVGVFGNYGALGSAVDNSRATRAVGIQVRIPLFDNAKRARTMESASQYVAEKARTRDLREQIELEVREALDNLRTSEEQVQVAREGLELAQSEVAQARRRYEAGVSTGLEVTDAQTRLERARDNHTAALYGFNVARIDLAQAMGAIRRVIQ